MFSGSFDKDGVEVNQIREKRGFTVEVCEELQR